jgi:hypothetical protein
MEPKFIGYSGARRHTPYVAVDFDGRKTNSLGGFLRQCFNPKSPTGEPGFRLVANEVVPIVVAWPARG